jgi:hypothetical protein
MIPARGGSLPIRVRAWQLNFNDCGQRHLSNPYVRAALGIGSGSGAEGALPGFDLV